MNVVCEECGDVGVKDLLLHCSNCKNASRHGYCLDEVIYDLSVVEWLCNDCLPKHNESIKSLEDVFNQTQLRNTQLDSSIINESNVKQENVSKRLWSWSWGRRRNRSCKGRKDRGNASKCFPSGNTFNWGHLINRSPKARRDSSDASSKQVCSAEVFNSREMFIGEMSKCNDSEKKGEDQNEHLLCALENVDGSSQSALDHASEIEEHTNFQKPMCGFKLTLNTMECPDLLKENDSSSWKYVEGFIPQGRKADLASLTNDVERSPPMIADESCPTLASREQTDGSSPTLAIVEKSCPLKAVKGLVYKQNSALASKIPPNQSNPVQGSDLKTGDVDVLNPSKECLDSWSKVAEPSTPLNEQEDSPVEKGAERTKCTVDEEIVIRTFENREGSNPSIVKECLVSNEGNSDEANRRSDELLLSTKDKDIQRQMSGEVHCVCDDPSERGNSWKVNEISNPKSAEGNQDGRELQCNAGKASSPAGKKVVREQVLHVEGINSEPLSSKYVTPCESTKINPRKHNQSNSYTRHETKYQKAKLIKNKNINAARSKRGSPAASPKDNQNTLGKDNSSNDKVIEPSMHKSRPCSKYMDLALKESSVPLNNPRSNCARRVTEANVGKPKKRRRLILPYDEDEDAEAMQVEDLNPRSYGNDGQVKKQRSYVENGVKNQRRYEEKHEVLRPGNLNRRSSKNHKQVKKQRSIEETEDRNADHCGVSRMPLISEYICMQPVDKPCWTGIMKIDRDYIQLVAHLSTKAGKKVHELSRSLPPIIKATELSTSKSCPKCLEALKPTADSIGLYFFSGDMRTNKELDQLVKHVADSSIVLETVVGLAKLLLFPSVVLPEEYQMFQGKHYLWGMFQPRKDKRKILAPAQQDCTVHVTEEERVQEQHVLDQPDKVPCQNTSNQEVPLVNQVENQPLPLLDANGDLGKDSVSDNGPPSAGMKALISSNIIPADHGQPCSNSEAPPHKLCGFVVSRTPKSAQLIQEMQKEGALLFDVQQVLTEPVSTV